MNKRLFYAAFAVTIATPILVAPAYAQDDFTDIAEESNYREATTWLKERGVITGYPDGTYRPQEPISRQHLLMLLSKATVLQEQREATVFKDVPVTSSYYETIQQAYRAGIVDGDAGYFYPQKALTRAQTAKILTRAFQLEQTATITPFLDVTEAHWAYDAIQALAAHDITTTANDYFEPNKAVTRGQMALFLYRLLEEDVEVPQLVGEWTGDIAIPQSPLTIRLDLQEEGTGTLSVPAQGIIDYPLDHVHVTNDSQLEVAVQLGNAQIKIEGVLQDGSIMATFTQNGMAFPIQFTRYEKPAVTYEEVTVAVTGGELKVALQLPETEEATPLAIIIAGSGATTKDGNGTAGENNSLKMLAEDLAAQGIASIRYDKRGVGENMRLVEREEDLSIGLYAEDVENIISQMQEDERFSTVHIIGHSEGSLVGMVAASEMEVASFTSIAGAGRSIDEILIEQLTAQLPEDLLTTSKEILAQLKEGQLVKQVPDVLHAIFRPTVQPYLMSWIQYDPVAVLQSLEARSLIVQGKNDLQVSTVDTEHLKQGVPQAEVVYFDHMNHVLKDAPTDIAGNYAVYANPTLPLADGLVETIAAFIKR